MTTVNGRTRKARYEVTVARFRRAIMFDRDFTVVDEVLTPDFVDHFAPPWDPPGREGVKYRFGQAQTALRTTKIDVLVSVREREFLAQDILIHFEHTGDFMGIPPTGRSFSIGGSNTFRFSGDQIAEHWGVFDVAKIPDLLAAEPGERHGGWASMWDYSSAES